jgi:hypothetical protein
MQLYEFKESLSAHEPPADASVYLQALWFDAKKDWDKAHEIVQDIPDKKASWIHAYLHRKEGDVFNSEYWYNRAAKKRPNIPLDKEWEEIAETFLGVRSTEEV